MPDEPADDNERYLWEESVRLLGKKIKKATDERQVKGAELSEKAAELERLDKYIEVLLKTKQTLQDKLNQ